MRLGRVSRSASMALVVAVIATPAAAASGSFYFGGLVGDAEYQGGIDRFDDGSIGSASIDAEESSIEAFVGYRINRGWSVEGGWVDFGYDPDDRATFTGASDGSGSEFAAGPVTREIESEGVYAALLLTAYESARLGVFIKGGYMAWRSDATTVDAAGVVERDTDGTDLMYGAGIRLRLFRQLWARGQWMRHTDVAGSDYEVTSLGLAFHFGR